ncbi:TonB-dependent receptor [Taibaiella helva]|uniref:TonB-dependent receptor n=1 Tax=Taibaiella helva TaxID=2301235 RepID=UPI000E58D526|nr:TonB-dependent receptor [Taibaiella helva]
MNKLFLRPCITLLCLIASHGLMAQPTISGKITDTSKRPLAFAAVYLLGSDSSVQRSTFADTAGDYRLAEIPAGVLWLKATAIGYAERLVPLAADFAGRLPDIVLKAEQHAMQEVSIVAARSLLERKPDRLIFNVASSVTVAGGTALDALKKTPGIWIRQQDNSINLVGKSAVQVMINDKLQQLSGEELMALLQSIPSDNIERIEVITAPPAQYDAAGNTGFVHIVLKKNNRQGLNGSLRAGYEQASYGKSLAGAELNYRSGKWNLYGNASYSNGSNQIVERLNTPYPAQLFQVTDDYKRILKPLQYTAGIDYEPNRNAMLGLQYTAVWANRANEGQTRTRALNGITGLSDSMFNTTSYSTARSSNQVLNLNYQWTIDSSGKKLNINANRLWFDGRRSNDFSTTHYDHEWQTPSGPAFHNLTNGRQDIGITTAQADVTLPYPWLSLSFGGKLSFIDNSSANHFYYEDGGQTYEDPSISNAFTYKERVQALYLSTARSLGRWQFQAGLRAEYTQTTGYSNSLARRSENRYLKLFPTAYLQYQLSDKHSWSLSYSKRINRPDYRSLDPYRAYATPYHYSEGNPFLEPSINHNTELSYTMHSRFVFAAFYQYEQNHFGSVWMIDPVKKVTSGISRNFADFMAYGLNATAAFQPFAFWEMQAQLSVQQQQLKSREYTATTQSHSLPMYYIYLGNSFSLNAGRTLLAELNGFYLSRYREDFLEIRPMGGIDAGFKVLLAKRKIALALNVSDMLASQKARGFHVVTGQSVDNYFDSRNLRLSVNYKWGNPKLKARRDRNTGIEEEKSRAGQ